MLKIIKYGDRRLQEKTEPVEKLTSEGKSLIKEMIEIMYSSKGVGLAANQVGVLKRIIVIDIDYVKKENSKKNIRVFINPEIIWESEKDALLTEGCLSFPGIEIEIYRPEKIKMKFRNNKFEEKVIEVTGLLARVIQHEIDHLNGIVFVDRIPFIKRKLIAGKLNRLKRQTISELSEITV